MLPEGKSIVVAGGNTGIGKAIVLAAAARTTTLTIIANALRVGDHIADRIGTTRHPHLGTVPTQSSSSPPAA